MARIAVTDVEGDVQDALLCFAEQFARSIHPQIDVILRRRNTGRALEQSVEMKFAQAGLRGQLVQTKLFLHVLGHPIGDLPELEAGQRRTARVRL